jgi:hypothetical protein
LPQEFEGMVRAFNKQWSGLLIYLLAITGSALLVTKLSSVVVEQLVVLAQPYLDNSPPKLSLVQQRRIDTTLALPPLPGRERRRVTALEAPSVSPAIIAARLDLAEKEDFEAASPVASDTDAAFKADSEPSSIAARATKLRIVRLSSKYATVSANHIFNRSFGVFTVAAN